jgi:EAL domain-containing protein (putative c-di-GMP-specific phosphodiesterase class I)
MLKILVIEDEESVRENLVDLLEAEKFQPIAAANGKIGLGLAMSENPDLILCDMIMPELDGYGVLSALHQEPITATIPFIFLTAKSAKSDFRRGMDMGADDYLTKPFTRSELLSAIMHKLEKYAALKQHMLNQTMSKLNPREKLIAASLRKLIQAEHFQQFEIYYQPIVDISTWRIVAAESLLRWSSSELGMLSPKEFIPVAESTGLIIPLGKWVLENVCHQIKIWHNRAINPISVSVNLSAIEFNQPDLIPRTADLIKFYNLPPHCLELELTESMIMQDVHGAINTMNQLQSLGVKIAADDFGTGYSSLNYLKHFPIHTLKIDRSFIQDIANDYHKSVITRALIRMGQELHLRIVAEGVETASEMSFLIAHKCHAIQGHIFSLALPLLEFEQILLKDWYLHILKNP